LFNNGISTISVELIHLRLIHFAVAKNSSDFMFTCCVFLYFQMGRN
jgi:hypothetical protein